MTPFFVTNGQKLVFGSRTADSRVDWYDNIQLGSSGTNSRIFEVRDNPFSTGDFVRITGDVLGDTNQTFLKTGTGLLELPDLKSFTGPVLVGGGMLRYTNLPTATPLILTGGVYGTSGTITRSLTNGASMVAWSPVTGGGFSAVGGPLTVYVDNGASDPLNLNVTTNFLKVSGVTGYSLILNSAFADNVVTFSNNLTTGSAGGNNWFIFQVDDNPSTTNDRAVLAGCFNTSSGRGVQKNGVGTLELINTNTFASTFNVNDGTVSLNCPFGNSMSTTLVIGDGIGASSSAVVRLLRPNQIVDTATVTLSSDGVFDMNGFDETVAGLTFAANTVFDTGTNTLSVASQYPIAANAGITGTVNGHIRVTAANGLGFFNGTLLVNAQLDTVAGFGLRGGSDTTIIFTNSNNIFRGSFAIYDGGNVVVRGSNVLNGVTVLDGSTVISIPTVYTKSVMIDGPYTVTNLIQRSIAGIGTAVHTFGGMNTGAGRAVYANTFTLAGNWPINLSAVQTSNVVEFGGAILDSGVTTNPVVISGYGSVIFSSVTNAYRGTTTVSNGTLLVNGKLLSGDTVTVMNGATLGGTGMIARAVVVAAGGTITAGASRTGDVGVLTISNSVTMAENSKLLCDFSGTTNDVLRVTGTLTLPTTATVVVSPIGTPGVVYPRVLFSANTLAGASGELTGWVLTDPRVGRIATQGNNVVMLAKSNGLALIIR